MKSLVVPVVLAALAGTAAAEEARTITLSEAIELAAGDSLAVDLQKEQISAARERRKATSALRFPTLGVKASVLMWNDAITFAQPCDPAEPPCPPSGIVELTVRDRVTGSAEVNLAQPISGLLLIGKLIDGDQAGIDVATAELQVAKLDAAYQATEAYLGALQTQTLRELSATSVTQLEADLVKIRALRDAHILADVDVLRLEAARDQAQAGALEADVAGRTARRGLALLLDLPDGTDLTLAPVDTTPPELGWSEDEAVTLARRQRPELRVAAARATQAEVGVAAAKANYFPNILAIANYTRTEGQGFIATKDSAFVGVTLDWNLWDWGKRGHEVGAAKAASRSAARLRDELNDQLAFDVRAKWLAASSKRQMLTVHASALRAAEEAYRLQTVKIQGGIATATDVIDAEAEVARARAQEAVARYQYLIAWTALVRAVGQMPQMPGAK
ncbi:MAG TPA: TolC family protein [Kofleriaceae bacterium]|nr:TolC family protein [Kofleriaceae bacterium]